MKNKKAIWVIIGIMLLILHNQTRQKMAGCTYPNCVDFSETDGTIQMHYGTNEDGQWEAFATDSDYQQFTRDVNTEYIRVWLSAHWYRTSTFAPLETLGYDWTNVDNFVDAVLSTGAKPFILFAHGDRCGAPVDNSVSAWDFSSCEGHGTVPPSDFPMFWDYVEEAASHFEYMCNNNLYSASCDPNEWYYEIMNEPYEYGTDNWNSYLLYYELFNTASTSIKSILPGAKVGGYAYDGVAEFLSYSNPDFIDYHNYPENSGVGCSWVDTPEQADDCDQAVMDSVVSIMHDEMVNVKQQAGSVEIISGEYHASTGNPVDVDRPFLGAWYMAALINQIKSKAVQMELVYQGTCGTGTFNDGCMGLWSVLNKRKLNTYYDKKLFTENHPTGATIHQSQDAGYYQVFATSSGENKYITVVRKRDTGATLDLQLIGTTAATATDLESQEEYLVEGGVIQNINFNGYEVKFLKVGASEQPYGYTYFVGEKNNFLSSGSFDNFILNSNQWVMA